MLTVKYKTVYIIVFNSLNARNVCDSWIWLLHAWPNGETNWNHLSVWIRNNADRFGSSVSVCVFQAAARQSAWARRTALPATSRRCPIRPCTCRTRAPTIRRTATSRSSTAAPTATSHPVSRRASLLCSHHLITTITCWHYLNIQWMNNLFPIIQCIFNIWYTISYFFSIIIFIYIIFPNISRYFKIMSGETIFSNDL